MDLLKKLNLDKYIFCHPKINLITIFDHYIYLRNDYDSLSASQRNYLIRKLKTLDYQQKSGKILENCSKPAEPKIVFSNSPSLGVNPLIELDRVYNSNDVFVVTPSTYALFIMASKLTAQDKVEGIKSLISKCPINLEQIKDFSQHTDAQFFIDDYYQEFLKFQDEVIKEKFKGRKIQL